MTAPAENPDAPASADDAAALSLAASIRIVKGNPTAEEVATLAALLIARMRLQQEARERDRQPEAPVHKLPSPRRPAFVAPGAWAS
ncbi:acyl-CoA carboxylase subunit epsilon [Streptomyces sp. NPDC057235]|uniref:acyl-CoA carboxylase subunit epsilon n=1 Tax=Streptomyces sp. NPDC057235 TaxID=3346058 RepID=UPI00363C0F92